jgi:protein gp37
MGTGSRSTLLRSGGMALNTKIEYCDSTINPVMGCTGCELYDPDPDKNHCYAASMCNRYAGMKGWPTHFTVPEFFPGRIERALKWPDLTGTDRPTKPWLNGYPRVIFFVDLGDIFCPGAPDPVQWLAPKLNDMAQSPHIWMILTKWPERMATFLWGRDIPQNFWLGTTVTTQESVKRRVWHLLVLGGPKVRWLSVEPILRPIDLREIPLGDYRYLNALAGRIDKLNSPGTYYIREGKVATIDWVVCGGESGSNRRPTVLHDVRQVKWQCEQERIPFFMKQVDKVQPIPDDLMIWDMPKWP